jgi:hypothetical protein
MKKLRRLLPAGLAEKLALRSIRNSQGRKTIKQWEEFVRRVNASSPNSDPLISKWAWFKLGKQVGFALGMLLFSLLALILSLVYFFNQIS